LKDSETDSLLDTNHRIEDKFNGMRKTVLAICSIAMLMVWSCSTPSTKSDGSENLKKSVINPNGDSELALLMRDMFDEGERVKHQVEAGGTPSGLKLFKEIHTAIPTDSNASGPVFESFATAYLNAVMELEVADSNSVFRFNRMVDQCMDCHSEFCPGPKRRIKKLYIKS
jgi:hypothetical protein